MSTNDQRDPAIDEIWRSYMTTGALPPGVDQPWFESPALRKIVRRIPTDPRCRLCYYPFGGVGGRLARSLLHLEPSKLNPHLCNICERFAEENPGGAELDVSLLFADIRGSTPLAASMSAYEFGRIIDRFYQTTTRIIYEHGGMVEKLVGDGVTAFFPPAFVKDHNHARAAVSAGKAILAATGHGTAEGPWVPIGVGVHTGEAFVGAVGEPGRNINIAVLGDNVNIAARLAEQAGAGEIVFSSATQRLAGLDESELKFRTLSLKGKDVPIDAWVFGTSK